LKIVPIVAKHPAILPGESRRLFFPGFRTRLRLRESPQTPDRASADRWGLRLPGRKRAELLPAVMVNGSQSFNMSGGLAGGQVDYLY
jgi:hypothetical protein